MTTPNVPENENAAEQNEQVSTTNDVTASASKPIMISAISKNTKILAAFAIVCTLAVAVVNELTQDIIKSQEHKNLLATLNTIIEPSRYNNSIANDCVIINNPALGTDKDNKAYIARESGEIVAVAITSTAPEGYNGNIDFILAINIDGSVNGVRVLKHQETPGLGDKVEYKRSDWITRFKGKSMLSETDSRWAVKKDNGVFDQFTGATITPRALIKGIKNTLVYFNKNKAQLLDKPNACSDNLSAPSNKEPSTVVSGVNIQNKENPGNIVKSQDSKATTQPQKENNTVNNIANGAAND